METLGMKHKIAFVGAVAVLSVAVAAVWLPAAPSIGSTTATPDIVAANEAAVVTIKAHIPDSALIPASVNLLRVDANGGTLANLGVLYDDGTNGDAVAGDREFARGTTLTEVSTGRAFFRVSAAFRGMTKRVMSSVVVVEIGNRLTHETAGYRIVVPSGYTSSISPAQVVSIESDAEAALEREHGGMWIYTYESQDTAQTLVEWWRANARHNARQEVITPITVNGRDALEVVLDPDDLAETHTLVKNGNRIYDIFITSLEPAISQQVLSTLQFN
jgi:hypothetical protein